MMDPAKADAPRIDATRAMTMSLPGDICRPFFVMAIRCGASARRLNDNISMPAKKGLDLDTRCESQCNLPDR